MSEGGERLSRELESMWEQRRVGGEGVWVQRSVGAKAGGSKHPVGACKSIVILISGRNVRGTARLVQEGWRKEGSRKTYKRIVLVPETLHLW